MLAVNHAELYGLFRHRADFGGFANGYALHTGIALLHGAGALLYSVLHWRIGRKELRIGMLPAAFAIVIFEIVAFPLRQRTGILPTPFLNLFFANELLLVLSLFFTALGSRVMRVWLGMLCGYVLLVAAHLRIGYWQGPWMDGAGELSRTAWYTALWSVGALAYLGAAIRYRWKRVCISPCSGCSPSRCSAPRGSMRRRTGRRTRCS